MDLSGRKHSLSGGTLSVPADHASVERTRRRRQMTPRVAIIGGGVSGLTCAVSFAERGFRTAIFAEQIGQQTTSGAAGALWFPYDAEPIAKVIPWAVATYKVLVDLAAVKRSAKAGELDRFNRSSFENGVSMIELCQYCRAGEIKIPDWANSLG